MDEALEALSNIDNVTVTHEEVITSYDDSAGILEVRYNITFDGDCVRGNVPTGDLTASCYSSGTTVLADVECRYGKQTALNHVRDCGRRYLACGLCSSQHLWLVNASHALGMRHALGA